VKPIRRRKCVNVVNAPGFPFGSRRILQRAGISRTLSPMEVRFTPEQEALLAQIATDAGTDVERLVKDAALRLLQSDAGSRAVLSEGLAAAMRTLRARVKPDPEGWTTRDYVHYGRR
jgi:hypothetical protein